MQLQLTWMGHSCLRVEHDGFVVVIDPGVLNTPDVVVGADALLISHEHADHYDTSKIAAAVAARPALPIWTNKSVAALLEQSGAGSGANVSVIGDGDTFDVGEIPVRAYGEWHAPLYPSIPPVRNTGFMLDGRLFHPGDAFTDPGVHVELLLVPLHGNFTRSGRILDYIRHLRPSDVSLIHDFTLDSVGRDATDAFLAERPDVGPGTGAPYSRHPYGVSVSF